MKVIGIIQDVTERKRAEEKTFRQLRELQVLHYIASICLENVDEYEIFTQVTKVIGNNIYSDHFGIMLVDDEQGVLRVHPSYSGITPEEYDAVIVLGEGVAGRVAKTNKALRFDDVSQVDYYFKPMQEMVSELCVPISLNGKVFGVINAESHQPAVFTEEDERLLKTIADLIASAMQRIRLLSSEKKRRIEAEANREASQLLTTSLDLDVVLDTILEKLKNVIKADKGTIQILNIGQMEIVAEFGFENKEDVIGHCYSEENQITVEIVDSKSPLIIDDVKKDSRFDNYGTEFSRGWMGIPLIEKNEVFGILALDSLAPGVFSEEDARLVQVFADNAAGAIVKARLFDEEKKRRIEAEIQREASELLTTSLDLDEVLSTILKNLTKVIESDQSSIHLFENEIIRIVAGHGFRNPDDVIGFTYSTNNQLARDIVNSRTPLVIEDATLDDRFEDFEFVNIRGWMGIPLIEKDTVIGILTVDSKIPGVYNEEHAELIQIFANNAAGAIVKARLFEEEKKRRLEAEIQSEISAIVTQNLDLNTILESILNNLQRYLEFDSAGILLEENGHLRIVATHGFNQSDLLNNRLVPKTHQLYQEILKKESVVVLQNAEEDDRFEDFGAEVEIRGWMGVPLIDQGKVIGYVSFDSKTPGKFTNQMAQLAQVLVNLTSSAIKKAQLFDDTQLALRRLKAQHDIDQIITSSVELTFAVSQILKIMISQLEIDAAVVSTSDPSSLLFNNLSFAGFRNAHFGQNRQISNELALRVVRGRKIIYIEDPDELQSHFGRTLGFDQEGFITYVGVPLIAKGEIKGVLELFHKNPLKRNSDWEEFLLNLATQLAIAIDNSQMFEDLNRSNLELSLAYDATIQGWAQALELKDMETEGHSRKVVDLTIKLATKIGISAEEIVHLRRGALLHDIGKMGIPDAILHKPGKLTGEEWEIMRQHPTYAKEWLSSIDYLKPALDIPYCHHERWDGSGYPRGLRGEDIPLSARIFALVDVWDALRSDRPYRKAWSKEKTIAHIKEQSGKHFDPKVVEAFLALLKKDKAKLNRIASDEQKAYSSELSETE